MSTPQLDVFKGAGEMRALFRDKDWSETALGPVSDWSEVLKLSVSLCLNSRFPLIVWWGPELTMLYNEPYIEHLQNKHPNSFGTPGQAVWTEIWDIVGPMLQGVLSNGEATYNDNLLLFLDRNGFLEETYHTFSYSAITDTEGKIVGILTPVAQTTERVIAERRLNTLRNLGRTRAETQKEILPIIGEVLRTNRMDLPLCAFFSLDSETGAFQLLMSNADTNAAYEYLNSESMHKNLLGAISSEAITVLENIETKPFVFPESQLGKIPTRAVITPVPTANIDGERLFFYSAVSPHQYLNESALSFFESVGREISTALKDARAIEHERQKTEALEELDRAKTVFFSNVSHEFRTPLTLMLGPIERLINTATDDERKEELSIVQRNAQRLLKLVNTLLDFSRIESSRYEARFEPTLLGDYVTDLASFFRSAIESAGLEFEVVTYDGDEKAYIDREMWEQIVFNLLSNAFKFTLKGKITIALRLVDDRFELSVQDSGIGIPEDELDNVFKRFHRLKSEGARTYEGSGIGLAMVSELVSLHGGSMKVESKKGVGSKFIASIPRGKTHLPEGQITEERKLEVDASHASSFLQEANSWVQSTDLTAENETVNLDEQAQHVLVADDNADMREYIRRLLDPLYSVRFASNGRDALNILNESEVDLLISDIMMPDMDGLELLREIRTSERLKNIPVLLLSARAGDEARAGGIEAGADEYLVKPFSVRELYARVTRLLQRKNFAQSLEAAIKQKTAELEAALETKSRFLSTVSHEVRSPISGIIGVMELIQVSPSLDEESKELVDVALDSTKRLLSILNDLLDASRLGAGVVKLEYRNFAVRPIIGDVVQLIRPDVTKKGIEIESHVGESVPEFLCGDELRLRQIIQNLVFNAVKFTSAGKIEISVDVLKATEEEISLKFSIKDTGIGISPDHQKKIFEAFVQAADSTTRVYGGTGLGLNISQTLVKLMHGEITVNSEIDKGSTFTVVIPFRTGACPAE